MKPVLNIALCICCVLSISSNAPAQQSSSVTATSTLQQELQHLGAAAASLDHTLPSFSCTEVVVSQRLHGKKIQQQTNFTATIRAKRAPDGALDESFWATSVEGKPFSGGSFNLPIYVSGGFDRSMWYFLPDHQACFRYSLSPGRITFETAPDYASNPACKNQGMSGFALLDPNGNVLYLERRVSAKAAAELHLANFAAFDFANIDLGGHIYRLSHHLVAEIPQGRTTGHFEATYSNCHLFTATVTLGPATEVPPDDTSKPH